jgi:hypothetical protein
MKQETITCGSRLNDTEYFFTNLGGLYRVYPLATPYADCQAATFTRWDDMWEWVRNNPVPASV